VTTTAANIKTETEEVANEFKATRLTFQGQRYDRESRYNQVIAGLYELRTHQVDMISDKHRTRSRMFFFGVLAAQAGVTISTFTLAARQKRGILWALAVVAGSVALVIATYVYVSI
jgi:hypothetical protein